MNPNRKVLCVDDDPNVLSGFERNLRKQFALDFAPGGEPALKALKENGPYAVVIADMQMPMMDGIEFLQQVRGICPDTVRIMLTGNADQATAIRAVNQGHVFQFLSKPCSCADLGKVIEAGITQHQLITVERELLDKTLKGAVNILIEILSTLDAESYGHSHALWEDVSGFAKATQAPNVWLLETAAMLCPIGNITIPGAILRKARAGQLLSDEEKEMVARIPKVGSDLVASIPRLEEVSRILLYQEKQFDGAGYPDDTTAGKAIPFGARVIKIFYDLIRLEHSGMPRSQAINQMQASSGVYDPSILQSAFAFLLNFHSAHGRTSSPSVAKVMLRDLKLGVVLASDVKTKDGALIVAGGTTVTELLLERLRNFAQITGVAEPILVDS